ncbi:lamin tail domain-containing protein [Patescibacteria group bacterium]|nr:lamin tail domain-containing protein [Patescibacteria group bacterium]
MNNVFKLLLLISFFFFLFFPQKTKASMVDNNINNQGSEELKKDKQNQAKAWQGIIIQEIFPNPCGKDKDKEWIRLYNSANTEINLKDWFLIDNYGLGEGYLFEKDLWLEDDDYLILERQKTNITLNNFQETLYLYTKDDKVADSISYKNAPENYIYSFKDQTYTWKHISKRRTDTCPSALNNNNLKYDSVNNNSDNKDIKNDGYLNWEELSGAKAEAEFRLTGSVLVAPGDLSSRYFLLSKDTKQSQVIQVYNHYSEFLNINPGDIISVTGRFSKIEDFYRIKTNTAKDIKILQSSFLSPPLNFNLDNLSLGRIYSLEAKIYTVNKNSLTVVYNNRNIKIDITLLNKNNIEHNYIEGQKIKIIGLLEKSSDELYLKLLPHYPQNQKYLSLNKNNYYNKDLNEESDKNNNYKKYLSFLSILSASVITLKYKKRL